MEELCKIAKAHYQASSDHVQKQADEFFNTMDRNRNGRVDLFEFLSFMEEEEGYANMTSEYFFKTLDLDRDGTLDFWEVMALYYIVKSGRPFCDHCKHFIPGTYFTCVGCLDGEGPIGHTFHLCLDCHLSRSCFHDHEGISKFLDNFSLLEAKIRAATNQDHQSRRLTTMVSSGPIVSDTSSAGPIIYNSWTQNNNTCSPSGSFHYHGAKSNPYILERQKWKIALGALDAAIQIGAIGATFSTCSIL